MEEDTYSMVVAFSEIVKVSNGHHLCILSAWVK